MTCRLATLLVISALLAACTTGANRFRAPRPRAFRLDTESVARVRHAGALGATGSSPTAIRSMAAVLPRIAPFLLTVLQSDEKANELQERLQECAQKAERQVNTWHFGDREPTREECGEELDVDGCGEPMTRAMLLGRQKHALALDCAREVLSRSWTAPFSIEQRYRYYRNARFLETISREQEQRLVEQGCTRELWRTIKPDLVLHPPGELLKALLIIDFKFPCPGTNTPTWRLYGKTSAYDGLNQGQVYKEALGGEARLLGPRGFSP